MGVRGPLALGLVCLYLAVPASAEEGVRLTRSDGGSIQTVLSKSIVLNDKSTLRREWIAAHENGFPADLVGTPGVTTVYVSERHGGDYRYQADWVLNAREPLTAIEVRFVCFDVWGDFVKTLVATEIQDLAAGQSTFESRWSLFSENECSEHYASIAYVARVRTKSGKVVAADKGPVMAEAKRFSAKFTEENLDPVPAPKKGG